MTASLPLLDEFGRRAEDLRVSLTDRCNLRCSYCMPAEGLPWLPREGLLTAAELARLISLAVTRLGVREVRFTGGEPLLRPDLEQVIAATAALTPRPEISFTTNGIGLDRRIDGLRAAGLDRVNVSLDTLDPATFTTLTRRDRHADVLTGLQAARQAGLAPVKINAVLIRGVNDHEAADLLTFCHDHGYELRFIEQMPLDPQGAWDRDRLVTAAEILQCLTAAGFELTPVASHERGSAPAERWTVNGGPSTVGIIASVTRPFCRACDRTRLTADGQVKSCLFGQDEHDLRTLLRAGATDSELATAWAAAMAGKPAGGAITSSGFIQPARTMSAVGG